MGKILIVVAIVVIGSLLWLAWSWYVTHDRREPAYTSTHTTPEFEIRRYHASLRVETDVRAADHLAARRVGMQRLTAYRAGNNQRRAEVTLVRPVFVTTASDAVSDATPEQSTTTVAEQYTVAAVFPPATTSSTAPVPNDERITVRRVPTSTWAVRRFSGLASPERIKHETGRLRAALTATKYTSHDSPRYAGYTPPWLVPPWQRHEVLLPVTASAVNSPK